MVFSNHVLTVIRQQRRKYHSTSEDPDVLRWERLRTNSRVIGEGSIVYKRRKKVGIDAACLPLSKKRQSVSVQRILLSVDRKTFRERQKLVYL